MSHSVSAASSNAHVHQTSPISKHTDEQTSSATHKHQPLTLHSNHETSPRSNVHNRYRHVCETSPISKHRCRHAYQAVTRLWLIWPPIQHINARSSRGNQVIAYLTIRPALSFCSHRFKPVHNLAASSSWCRMTAYDVSSTSCLPTTVSCSRSVTRKST